LGENEKKDCDYPCQSRSNGQATQPNKHGIDLVGDLRRRLELEEDRNK
jgi:hypothetical protein